MKTIVLLMLALGAGIGAQERLGPEPWKLTSICYPPPTEGDIGRQATQFLMIIGEKEAYITEQKKLIGLYEQVSASKDRELKILRKGLADAQAGFQAIQKTLKSGAKP